MANNDFIIVTDADSDIPIEWAQRYAIEVIPVSYTLDGNEYLYTPYLHATDHEWFYEKLRNGGKAVTAMPGAEDIKIFFERFLRMGKDILYIAVSSKFSGLVDVASNVASELLKKYPQRKIIVHDSLSVSAGQSLLVRECARLKENGATLKDLENWLNRNTQKACFLLAFSDITALKKGGRLTSGINSGSLLGVNTLMLITQDGRIEPFERVKGRKRALRRLLETVGSDTDDVFIVYTDCPDDARFLSEHFDRCDIGSVSPVVGTHLGSGTVGIAFFNEERREINGRYN